MDRYDKMSRWIEDLPKRGKITFSRDEIDMLFPNMTKQNINNILHRLVLKKKIQSVWRGFFVVIPVEYALRGVVDAVEYIDQLMAHLGQKYYIALLSAAAMHGAAHQQPMVLMLVVESKPLREKSKNDVKITFVTKKEIPSTYLQQIKTRNGYIQVSTPELTAMDLVFYLKKVGGINRVATVLNELAEVIDFKRVENDFFVDFDTVIVQRLGYLLDELGYDEIADVLFEKAKQADLTFRNFPLSIIKNVDKSTTYQVNKKWGIIINEQIEIDDDT
ncbi:MAG: type IV toxin-antitoxin system AbiEi family antitoxin [Tannerellaceae bacterium]|jgi:predicted transcriptional regulator of viral defense system|nr:type IV toxin-antitoxin system AbiEi family antitoxin [Tannerellaceae bacterium]